jgi:drug/metabolite transporter (DMT)-like permease
MTLTNLILILFSACIHVVAHVALRRTTNRAALVWWVLFWGCALFSPVLVFSWQTIPPLGWVIMISSAVFELGYYYTIARAYATGDEISIIYPLARGTAPVLLLMWTALFLREFAKAGGALGVVVIALGLYLLNLPKLGAWREPIRAIKRIGPRWALLAGLCISAYSVIDRVGITLVNPLLYVYISLCITLLFLTVITLREVGWTKLKAELRLNWLSSVIAGLTNMAAYAIVLYTVQQGTPASYAGATREISVVFGVLVGVLFLGERRTVMKFVGAACVAGGVMLIKLLG